MMSVCWNCGCDFEVEESSAFYATTYCSDQCEQMNELAEKTPLLQIIPPDSSEGQQRYSQQRN